MVPERPKTWLALTVPCFKEHKPPAIIQYAQKPEAVSTFDIAAHHFAESISVNDGVPTLAIARC
jgi:hypothetical protein